MNKIILSNIIKDLGLPLIKLTRTEILSEVWIIDFTAICCLNPTKQRTIFNCIVYAIQTHQDCTLKLESLLEPASPIQLSQFSDPTPKLQILYNPSNNQILIYLLDVDYFKRQKKPIKRIKL